MSEIRSSSQPAGIGVFAAADIKRRTGGREAAKAAERRVWLNTLAHMVDDHTVYALWLGTPIQLKLDTMQRRGYRAELLPTA